MDNGLQETLKKLDIIKRHKAQVQNACELLGQRLIERGEVEFGIRLITLGYEHDLSKFDQFERKYLIVDDKEEDNKTNLRLAIEKHQSCNRHHIEYWGDFSSMPRIFVAELVCDLYSRSAEFGTNLRDYIKEKMLPRYDISTNGKGYKTLKEFVDLLLDKPFSSV